MLMFRLILLSMLLADAAWWRMAENRFRRKSAALWLMRLFLAGQSAYMLWALLMPQSMRHGHVWLPTAALTPIYIWHLLILPLSLVAMGGWKFFRGIAVVAKIFYSKSKESDQENRADAAATAIATAADATATADTTDADAADIAAASTADAADVAAAAPSRRQFLGQLAAVTPQLLTLGASGVALRQMRQFRVRQVQLPLARLPAELDGLSIVHLSDLHVGRWTEPQDLRRIADAANALRADLVLFTGDLIDLSIDALPQAMYWLKTLDPRGGLYLCEGNHDLIDSPVQFEKRMRQAGWPLLLDQRQTVRVRGQSIELMGTRWRRDPQAMAQATAALLPADPEAFSILLSHHPHGFDAAAAGQVPLTLSGHTHGGQLMLNERLGAGPAMFRYWSGLYRQGDSALMVSNGVGNWFPLRTAAPAEIVQLVLRRPS